MIDRSQKVYMAHCVGPDGNRIGAVKIGCSHGWNERIKDVTANLPFTLELAAVVPGGFFMEAACHLYLKSERIGGEYFLSSEKTLKLLSSSAKDGQAFQYISDSGSHEASADMIKGLLEYHDISVDDACERAGISASYVKGRAGGLEKPSRKLLAGAALVASSRHQFCNWPDDGFKGLLGEKSSLIRYEHSEAAE
jgi:hypothetical protein